MVLDGGSLEAGEREGSVHIQWLAKITPWKAKGKGAGRERAGSTQGSPLLLSPGGGGLNQKEVQGRFHARWRAEPRIVAMRVESSHQRTPTFEMSTTTDGLLLSLVWDSHVVHKIGRLPERMVTLSHAHAGRAPTLASPIHAHLLLYIGR